VPSSNSFNTTKVISTFKERGQCTLSYIISLSWPSAITNRWPQSFMSILPISDTIHKTKHKPDQTLFLSPPSKHLDSINIFLAWFITQINRTLEWRRMRKNKKKKIGKINTFFLDFIIFHLLLQCFQRNYYSF
jgi:hypothetical protein